MLPICESLCRREEEGVFDSNDLRLFQIIILFHNLPIFPVRLFPPGMKFEVDSAFKGNFQEMTIKIMPKNRFSWFWKLYIIWICSSSKHDLPFIAIDHFNPLIRYREAFGILIIIL